MGSTCSRMNTQLGVPGEGIHQYRLGGKRGTTQGVALVDLVLTLVGAGLIGWLSSFTMFETILLFLIFMVASVLVHALFCVPTTLARFFFPCRFSGLSSERTQR